jgi:hypothetical protein
MRQLVTCSLALLCACATVLGIRPASRRVFEHRAHLLEGVSCVDCHRGIDEAGDRGPLHLPGTEACLECHEAPHTSERCSNCHGLGWVADRARAAKKHLRFEHRAHVEETKGNCARCHVDVAEERSPLLPPMASCLSCHEHQGEFDARLCDRCHIDLEEEGARPESHLVHREDFVRNHSAQAGSSRDLCESCHSDRFCTGCHGVAVPALPSRMSFDRVGVAGLHRAGFAARHREEASTDPGLCASCHRIETCQSCHEKSGLSATGEVRRNPHPSGWIGSISNGHGPAARRDPMSCAACHGGAGEMLCVRCHQVGGIGGSVHPPGWKSERSRTGDTPCRLCHVR